MDELVGSNVIVEKVVAQIGNTEYKPMNFEWFRFDDYDSVRELMKSARVVVTHAGAGSIYTALGFCKPLVVVPRRTEFNEHYNDHQVQLARALSEEGICEMVLDIRELREAINRAVLPRRRGNIERIRERIKKNVDVTRYTCIVCNPGGHYVEAKPFLDLFPNSFYVVIHSRFIPKELTREKVYYVVDPNISIIRNLLRSIWIVLKERPRIVFSTGAGLAASICYFSKLLGAKIIYVESLAQVDEKSSTGRLIYPIADLFFVQWPELAAKYGEKAIYEGAIC
jgi:UDP-N-acetylglucosamine transferase subunit ALG13